jgi:TRAP-type mannitol/chloroaromatic compound transport system permease small subunit
VNAWLGLSRRIDALNERIGRAVGWLILAMTVISALNAVSRKAFSISSNAFLEVQWYLFAAVFLLAGGSTLLKNGHVRIDLVASRLSERTRLKVELFGTLVFLFPFVTLMLYHAWPFFMDAVVNREVSINAGGLWVAPVKFLVPAGFALLWLQGLSQAIKVTAVLSGGYPADRILSTHSDASTPGAPS